MIHVTKQRDIISRAERSSVEWPSTIRRLAPDWTDLRCARNGSAVPESEWDEVLADGDFLHFYSSPGLIPVPFSAAVVAFLNQVGIAIALSIVARLLMPAKKPNKRDEADSANNSFANLQSNDRFEGVPMLVVYGRHRVAGPIVHQVVRTSLDASGNPVSEVFLLVLLCDGQVQAIGGKTSDGGPFLSEDASSLPTLQLNNQPVENFEDVEAHVRLGTDEQEVIPGFETTSVQRSVDRDLTFPRALHKSPFSVIGAVSFAGGTGYTDGATVTLAGGTGTAATFRVTAPAGVPTAVTLLSGGSYSVPPPSPNTPTGGGGSGLTIEPDFDSLLSAVGDGATDPTGSTNTPGANTAVATPGRFAATSTNITKWDNFGTPVAYTMGEEADEFALLISLPQGLGDFDQANPAVNTLAYQVRYRAVDALGIPFGDYIVLDVERVALARHGAFQLEYRRRFYDPAPSYIAPQFGQFLRGRAAGNRGASTTLNVSAVPARSKANTDLSFAAWIRPTTAIASGEVCVFNTLNGNRGCRLNLVRETTPVPRVYFKFVLGDGSALRTMEKNLESSVALAFFTNTTDWTHLAFAYDGDGYSTLQPRVYLYVNGVLATYHNPGSNWQMDFDPAATFRVQADSSPTPTFPYNCGMDEPTLWSKRLTDYDVARLYNNRAPLSTFADAPGLLVGGRFDGTSGTTGLLSFGPAAATAWVLGNGSGSGDTANPDCSAEPTSANGIVKTLESGVPTRGRYLIEVQRCTVEDEAVGVVSDARIDSIELATFDEFCYPGCALLAVRARATDQLSGGAPLVTVVVDGRLVPVWDGADPIYPTMVPTWSRNPAWIAADIITNPDYGLGNVYSARDLDVQAFKDLADYCDELIFDNGPRILLVEARQIEAADNANLPVALQGGTQDFVRYRVASLPSNWPQPGVVSSRYMRARVVGTPSPAVPAWLATEVAAAAQAIRYVEFVNSGSGFFYIWAESSVAFGATGTAYTPGVSSTNYVDLEHHDVRFRYDGVFDRADVPAWEAASQVLQTARAVPIKIGRRVSVFVDKPSSPVALITMASVVQGTFVSTAQGVANRPNAEQAEFFDEDLNYERTFASDEHPELTDPSKQSAFNFRRIRLEGITRRGQVKRHLRRDLNTFFLLRKVKSFEMGTEGISLVPGDVVLLSHDVPGYGISGQLLLTSANQTSVKLDRPVTLASGPSYVVVVQQAATGARETKPVTSGAGTYAAGTAINVGGGGFSFTPEEGDLYALGESGKEAQPYRVIESIIDPQTLRRKVKCLEVNNDVYLDDFGELPNVSPTNLPVPSAPVIPPGVENLVVTEQVERGPDGSARVVAMVSFSHFADTFQSVAGVDLYVSAGGYDLGRASAQHVATLDRTVVQARVDFSFERDKTYTIWVVPRAVSGARYRVHASFATFVPSGLSKSPPPPRSPRATVAGRQALHEWDDDGDREHDLGAIVEIRQGGWLMGLPVAAAPAQVRRAVVASWSAAPTNAVGATTPRFVARSKSRSGQYGEAAVYEVELSPSSTDGDALSESLEETW